MLILDSSALFSMEDLPQEEFLCPPGVVNELKRYNDKRLDRWGDLLRTSDCTKGSTDKVKDAARKSGDLGRLSDVDISVLALALDMNGTILSDDYSIQNVSSIMGIPFRSVGTPGIKRTEKWNYQCKGCGKWSKEQSKECLICGSEMISRRKR